MAATENDGYYEALWPRSESALADGPGGEPFVGQVLSPNGGTAFAG